MCTNKEDDDRCKLTCKQSSKITCTNNKQDDDKSRKPNIIIWKFASTNGCKQDDGQSRKRLQQQKIWVKWRRIFNSSKSWQLETQGNVDICLLQMHITSSSKGDCRSKITLGQNMIGVPKRIVSFYFHQTLHLNMLLKLNDTFMLKV